MMFYTHVVFALLVSLISIEYFNFENKVLFILIVLISSIMVDIDNLQSKISKNFRFLSLIVNFFFKHRGFIHTIWIPIGFFILFIFLNLDLIGFAFLIGYLSHLFLDAISRKGVRLFVPFSNYRVHGFIKVGGWIDFLLFILLIVLIISFVL